jgi:nucleotide-binding universal stress UspA family protein
VPEWYENNARHVLAQAETTLATAQGGSATTDVQTAVEHGSVIPTLTDASTGAQLIVVGSRGQGAFGRLLMGSVSTGMVHHAHCPVVVVHEDGTNRPGAGAPVLLGVDGSPASEAATALAFDEASRRGVDLIALHAWSDFGVPTLGIDWRDCETEGQEALAERLAGWQERYPDVRVHRRIVCDKPARWLSAESRKAQLVVVGSHGRGGFAGMLLGSVSSAVAQSSSAPVIVVRGA